MTGDEYAASSEPDFQSTLPVRLSKDTSVAPSLAPTGTITASPSTTPEPLLPRRVAVPVSATTKPPAGGPDRGDEA